MGASTSLPGSRTLAAIAIEGAAEYLPDALLLVDPQGNLRYANRAARARMAEAGAGPEARHLSDFVDNAVHEIEDFLGRALRTRAPVPGTLSVRRPEGPLRMRCDAALVRAASAGQPPVILVRCTHRDESSARFLALNSKIEELAGEVQKRARMEQLLARQNEVLRLIAQSAPLVEVLHELAAMVEEYSGKSVYASILLLETDGIHLRHGAAPRLPESYTSRIDGVAIGEGVGSCGTSAWRKQPVIVTDIAADPLWADYKELALSHGLAACWSTPICSTAGRVLGTFAIYYPSPHAPAPSERQIVDIATRTAAIGIERQIAEEQRARQAEELARSNEQLAASNAELERYAYVASHDLKEPLRQVGSFVQLLDRRYRDQLDRDAREYIGYIVSGVARMVRLVDGLLDFSRTGREEFATEPVDMNAVLSQALQNLEHVVRETGARIECPEQLPSVRGDSLQLVRVFQNLIGNGVKFRAAEAPRIRVTFNANQGGRHVFSITDNGIGIAPQYHARIFEMFQRLHSNDVPGSGIGLSVCRKIVERLGGTMWVESQEGEGSTFSFSLPAGP